MKSLFLKIFLWFWLASILIIISTFVMISLFEPYAPMRDDGRSIRRLAKVGRSVVAAVERNGHISPRRFERHKRSGSGRHIFLFDENSVLVHGKHPPRGVKEIADKARKSGATEFLKSERGVLIAQTVYGSEGAYYIVVGELPRPPKKPVMSRLLDSRFLSMRLLAICIIASIFCYWLAWYLTSPARKLRAATRRFASGDLHTRVMPELGSRKDELADLGKDFDLMAERIEGLIDSQGRLLRDISHELRSPLARLNVALELARQRSGEEAKEHLDRIELESERLNRLIGQLRTLLLLENGPEQIERREFDFVKLVEAIAADADFEAKNRNCAVRIVSDESVRVNGSEELLGRAVENVLRNAVRYTAEETVVDISLRSETSDGNSAAVLIIRDHGPGVPEESLDDLFTPFYRVAESRDRRSGGMGIGLAITERAVRLHGGTVRASNAEEGGLIIRLELPL